MIKIALYQKPKKVWCERITPSKKYPRHWITVLDMAITLSDGHVLTVEKGTIWDGASIPKYLWWLFSPIDEGAIGDFIHDILWVSKEEEFERWDYNIFQARLYADNERHEWRKRLAPKKWIKNEVTHFFIRKIGGFYYSKQLQIPD